MQEDLTGALSDVLNYCLYAHSLDHYEYEGEGLAGFKNAKSFFNVIESEKDYYKHQLAIIKYKSTNQSQPKTSLNMDVFWDYYNNDKTEFEVVTLLAFLGLRSIIGTKSYIKTADLFIFSRMDGQSKCLSSFEGVSKFLAPYTTRHKRERIRNALEQSWGLKFYSYRMRGYLVSFKLSLDDLAYQGESGRKKYKDKKLKEEKTRARQKALDKIKSTEDKSKR